MKKAIILICVFIMSCNKNVENLNKENIMIRYFHEPKSTHEYSYIIQEGDTIKHGKFIIKNEKGQIIAKGNYNYGENEGEFITFHEDGSMKSKSEYRDSKETGELIFYYPNGNIQQYGLYDNNSQITFVIDFDENEKYKMHQGSLFADWFYSNKNPGNLKEGDTIKYGFIIPNIPNVKKEFSVELLGSKNVKTGRKIKELEPFRVMIEEKVIKSGENIYKAKLKLEFNDDLKTVVEDSIELSYDFK